MDIDVLLNNNKMKKMKKVFNFFFFKELVTARMTSYTDTVIKT